MQKNECWRMGLQTISAVPARSILTTLGMAIGIAAVLAVITLGEAGRAQVDSEMRRLGIDRVWITAAEGSALRNDDAQLLSERLATQTAAQIYLPAVVRSETNEKKTTVAGISKAYMEMTGIDVVEGRNLFPNEWTRGSRSVLIGKELAEVLKTAPGEWISIGGKTFEVVGVTASSNGFSQVDAAASVMIPAEILLNSSGQYVHEIILDVPTDRTAVQTAQLAQQTLAAWKGRSAETMTMDVQIQAAESVLDTFVKVLGWVALICVLVGGIGIMNILLVSIRERKREIGIMKSMGAGKAEICSMFLCEALIYAVSGGIAGIVLGILLIFFAGKSIGVTTTVRAVDCMLVFLAGQAVGLVFGVAPAAAAARLKPVDALRQE
ncbi:MAG: ABC transporter permease [Clostridia bacterium]|nr:ABC transporter permease [Clostridia bacterium]